jgi:hypothetical protein
MRLLPKVFGSRPSEEGSNDAAIRRLFAMAHLDQLPGVRVTLKPTALIVEPLINGEPCGPATALPIDQLSETETGGFFTGAVLHAHRPGGAR